MHGAARPGGLDDVEIVLAVAAIVTLNLGGLGLVYGSLNRRIDSLEGSLSHRLDRIETRLDDLERRVRDLEQRFTVFETQLNDHLAGHA